MAGSTRARLSIDLEPEMRRLVKIAAAERDVSVRDYVVGILRRELDEHERSRESDEGRAWQQLSANAFTRDWDCEEDQAYDRLA